MSRGGDWLTALDDGLTGRLRRCTLCGGSEGRTGWWDIMQYEGLAIAVIVCDRCRASDPEREALDALLQSRYGEQRRFCQIKGKNEAR